MTKYFDFLENYLNENPRELISLEKLSSVYANKYGAKLTTKEKIILKSELKYSTSIKVINIYEDDTNKTAFCLREK